MAHIKDEIREFSLLKPVNVDLYYLNKTQIKLLGRSLRSVAKEFFVAVFITSISSLIRFLFNVRYRFLPFKNFLENISDYIDIEFYFFIILLFFSLISFLIWKLTTPNADNILSEVQSQVLLSQSLPKDNK